MLVAGCGSNDILDSAMRALGASGSTLAYTAPTFAMTPHFAARATSSELSRQAGPAPRWWPAFFTTAS
jgi:histidinol-phosphate/aromatic aminotransferase/cobyric acid decarboxylase-like protein